jgi:hypothetical protein
MVPYCAMRADFNVQLFTQQTYRNYPMFDALLSQLETDLRAALGTCITGLVSTARARLEGSQADIAKERATGLADVDAKHADLGREVAAMYKYQEAQEGRVELNIGGYRFETSVQTLRQVPHTFIDAYFSGRYAQDVCNDGSIFVDRDGEHFGHVLDYMRDGVVSVAIDGSCPSVSLLRALKREYGFYCIELTDEAPSEPERLGAAFVLGGIDDSRTISSMERYNASSGKWGTAAAMGTGRFSFGACSVAGNVYVIGGCYGDFNLLASVEKYSPLSDTWSVVASLTEARASCAAVSVGPAIYVLGGDSGEIQYATASVLKFACVQGTWIMVAAMPAGRSDCTACVVGTDIYVFGGEDTEENEQASVFKYDTEADTWSVLPPMPANGFGHSVSVIEGLMYITGAGDSGRDLLRLDPVSGVCTTLTSTRHRRSHAASFVFDGYLYVAGGTTSHRTIERYDTTSNAWTSVRRMREGRQSFSVVTIGPIEGTEEQNLFDSLITKAICEGQ